MKLIILITPKDISYMGARENKLPISQNDLAHNIFSVFSQFL